MKKYSLLLCIGLIVIMISLGVVISYTSYIINQEKKIEKKIEVNNLEWVIADLKDDIKNQKRIIEYLEENIVELKAHELRIQRVKITFYAPALRGINSDSNPNRTATMQTPIVGWTVAISRDLVKLGWLGKQIYIEGIGIRHVTDIMGSSVNGKKITNQIDICCGKRDVRRLAKNLGKNTDILACILN